MQRDYFYKILKQEKISLAHLCNLLKIDILKFEKDLENNTVSQSQIEIIAKFLCVDVEDLYENEYDLLLQKIKYLLKSNGMSFSMMCQVLNISSSSLYKSFTNKTITLNTLKRISGYLGVHSSYFYEDIIVQRFTEEIIKYPQNPDLKGFMIGFSRDISKGVKLQDAVFKNIDRKGYNSPINKAG